MSFYRSLSELKLIRALYSGIISAVVIFTGTYIVGSLGETEARIAIQEMRPSLRFICSAVLTATSTILALLLTVISFSSETERDIKSNHYRRIRWIARLCTVTFVAAVVLLMVLTLPLKNSDVDLGAFHKYLYYGLLVYGAVLGGMMISIVLMLYRAANVIILIFHPHQNAESLFTSQEKSEKESVR